MFALGQSERDDVTASERGKHVRRELGGGEDYVRDKRAAHDKRDKHVQNHGNGQEIRALSERARAEVQKPCDNTQPERKYKRIYLDHGVI